MDAEQIKIAVEEELKKTSPDWHQIELWSRARVESDPDNVRFTVDAGHIQRLGAELVGKQDTALSELVKNAYDADATKVVLTFTDYQQPGGTLVIEDDGSGMQDDIIRSSWMRISTASKVDQPLSPIYRRVRAGRKGIGRFSVQRLGKWLYLETRPRGSTTGFCVRFNWDEEFRPGRDLNEVFSQIKRFEKPADECGTTLRIVDLRDAWSEAALAKVWRSVLLLQPPFPVARSEPAEGRSSSADPGFAVNINGISRDTKRSEYSIESSFLSQAYATISASIDENGHASVRVVSSKSNLDDSQEFDKKFLVTGPVSLNASYFIYQSSTLSGMNMTAAAELGRLFGGIRIYRNGFRVLPYGEAADDWLELDFDVSRRQVIVPFNNRNFFGHVELTTDANPLFEETSSREGLLENEAYAELKQFVRDAVEWAAKRVAAARNRKQDAGQRDFIPEPRRPSEYIRTVRENMGISPSSSADAVQTDRVLAKAEAIATEFEQRVEEQRTASLEYEEMLRLLASLGLSISVFGHEVKGARDALRARLALLEDAIKTVRDERQKAALTRQFSELKLGSDRMFDIGGYISGLMSTTESRQLRPLSVSGALQRFATQFTEYMSRQNVEFEVDVDPPSLRTTPMHGSELDSVLLNFLTNSIKSMRNARVKDRKVRMDARSEGRFVVIGFEDNGPGIAPTDRNRVFDAFFTTTMAVDDDGVAGPGTGLGLKIVSDIAASYGGGVSVEEASPGYGCRFEFRVLALGEEA
ncbi:sensor histidine kinase [Pannonibacter phragmitetus]|uniref:sensor histidine kinase n=1 Tax=Pannonibacter phragmitetus TaxID=121719 RepID=UPI000B968AF2|nr:ATP-binding protein [Pannonibacter phragmitetus]